MLRIAIADDHALIRLGLRAIVQDEPDMELVGEAATGRDAIELCRDLRPDVLVLDFDLPDIDGLEVTTQLTSAKPCPRILILTMHDNEEYAIRVLQAGAAGFVVKDSSSSQLPDAIRKIAQGKMFISHEISEKIALRNLQSKKNTDNLVALLSNRELQVLIRIARGLAPKEIAEELCLGYSTVENYKRRILDKLNLRNNSDITRFAIRNQLINDS